MALCPNMNFQIIASFLIAFPLKSSLHAHIIFPFTLLPSYTSFSPLTSPNSPLSSNNSFRGSFLLSDTRSALPTTTTYPHPVQLYFPSSSFTDSLSLSLSQRFHPLSLHHVLLSLPPRPQASPPLTSSRSLVRPPPLPCPFRSFSHLLHNRARGCQPAPRNTL